MNKTLTYSCILADQSPSHSVFSFCATAQQIHSFAQIDRIGRTKSGQLRGFQRPQIANHIKEIQKYLARPDAILANPIVVAFTDGVTLQRVQGNIATADIDVSNGPIGFVVDGQQRLSALSLQADQNFEVFVSAILCENEEELRKQFILINNTRPLPKSLIYELLPTVSGLPTRYDSRAQAARLVERLNFDEESSLFGQIKQHTNPTGVLSDTAIQRLIMNSLSDGALREIGRSNQSDQQSFELLSNFFAAVQSTFPDSWSGHSPRTSRLVHGAGLVAMGYVMEYLWASRDAQTIDALTCGLAPLREVCSWTSGSWSFGPESRKKWNAIQNLSRDWTELGHYLIACLKPDRNRPLRKIKTSSHADALNRI